MQSWRQCADVRSLFLFVAREKVHKEEKSYGEIIYFRIGNRRTSG